MDILAPLYFPDSLIDRSTSLSLAALFNHLRILRPVAETDPASGSCNDPGMDADFCQVQIPCPLQEDEQQGFQQMIKEIRTQGDGFITQLKMMTIASMTAPGKRDESSQSILSALFPASGKTRETDEQNLRLELWQARLILKLAEIVDMADSQLAEQLGSLEGFESDMLQQLQGETGGAAPSAMPPRRPTVTAGMENRFRAWKTLFKYGKIDDSPVWVSVRPDGADILFRIHEKQFGHQPFPLMELPLPTPKRANPEEFARKLPLFRQETRQFRQQLTSFLTRILDQKVQDPLLPPVLPDGGPDLHHWQEAIDHIFPEEQFGRDRLSLNLFPGTSFGTLFNKKNGTPSPCNNGILALVLPVSDDSLPPSM